MNRVLSCGGLALVALIFLAGASETPAVPVIPASLDVSIEVAPTYPSAYELLRERNPATFTCMARLADPVTHKILGIVSVEVSPGKEATKTVTSGDLTVTLKGKIGGARNGAIADLTVLRNGELVTRQKSTLLLTGQGRSTIY